MDDLHPPVRAACLRLVSQPGDSAVKVRPAREIGDELDMTAKAVRQAKFRVGKKLRVLLADDVDVIFPDATSPDQAAS